MANPEKGNPTVIQVCIEVNAEKTGRTPSEVAQAISDEVEREAYQKVADRMEKNK